MERRKRGVRGSGTFRRSLFQSYLLLGSGETTVNGFLRHAVTDNIEEAAVESLVTFIRVLPDLVFRKLELLGLRPRKTHPTVVAASISCLVISSLRSAYP